MPWKSSVCDTGGGGHSLTGAEAAKTRAVMTQSPVISWVTICHDELLKDSFHTSAVFE
jgi:hypothetical protein